MADPTNHLRRESDLIDIPIRPSLGVLGRKWTARILVDIGFRRICRFNQLIRVNPGLPRRLLSKRLDELEASEMIRRKRSGRPSWAVVWSLTPKGAEMLPVLMELMRYGSKWNNIYTSRGIPPRLVEVDRP